MALPQAVTESHAAYHAAVQADEAWHAELVHLFGKKAGDVRYTSAGRGEPGSRLNMLYLAFQEASERQRVAAENLR